MSVFCFRNLPLEASDTDVAFSFRSAELSLLYGPERPVPTFPLLVSQTFSVLTAHAICYPGTTILVRYINNALTLREIPSLFTNWDSFLGLYKGIGYHMAWTALYQTCVSISEYRLHYGQLEAKAAVEAGYTGVTRRDFLYLFLDLGLFAAKVLGYPLQVKALHDQAAPFVAPYTLTWRMSFLRYFIMFNTELFKK